jgi:hypothetical protein
MSFAFSDQCQMLFPRFVFHRQYLDVAEFNKELFQLASRDALANRTDGTHERAIGDKATHLAHLRHNFLADCKHPAVAQLIRMADETARAYLKTVYAYEHRGEIELMSDTFHQQRSTGENVGINCHVHFPADLTVNYYARIDRDPSETNPLRLGALRFYDPQHLNTRVWPNKNPAVFTHSWYNLVPNEGSMVVFEGHMPHDSTYFEGEHRLCIPIMAIVRTPRKYCTMAVSELLNLQANEPTSEHATQYTPDNK